MTFIGNSAPLKIDEKNQISGTHAGKLSPEARERRRAKNARNASRSGQETRPRGSQRKPNPKGQGKR